jgi:hypothetical protein
MLPSSLFCAAAASPPTDGDGLVSTPSKRSEQRAFARRRESGKKRDSTPTPAPPPEREVLLKAVEGALSTAADKLQELHNATSEETAFYLLREEVQDIRRQFAAQTAVDPGEAQNVAP